MTTAVSNNYPKSPFIKYLALIVLSIGGGSIYVVPYLLGSFTPQMMDAFSLDKASVFGLILVVYGIACTILYVPAGMLADKMKAKTLFAFSMISTGILTIAYSLAMAFATAGEIQGHISFFIVILIHVGFAITTVLTFWSAFVKAVGSLGPVEEHSKLYGYSEGTKAISAFLTSIIAAMIVSGLMTSISTALSLSVAILFLAIVYIIVGIASIILLPKEGRVYNRRVARAKRIVGKEAENKYLTAIGDSEVNSKNLRKVLKMPIIWMISILVLFIMVDYDIVAYRTTPYFLDIAGFPLKPDASDVAGNHLLSQLTMLSSVRMYAMAFIFAILTGLFSTKVVKDTNKTIVIVLSITIILALPFLFAHGNGADPVSDGFLWTLIILSMVVMLGAAGARAIYWSLIAEGGVPSYLTGLAIGIISIIGFSKDIWFPILIGVIQDAKAWYLMWGLFIFCALGGILMAIAIYFYIKNPTNIVKEETATKELKQIMKLLKNKDIDKTMSKTLGLTKEYDDVFNKYFNAKLSKDKTKDKVKAKEIEKRIKELRKRLDQLRIEGKETFINEFKEKYGKIYDDTIIEVFSNNTFDIDKIVFGEEERIKPEFGAITEMNNTIDKVWSAIDERSVKGEKSTKDLESKLEYIIIGGKNV